MDDTIAKTIGTVSDYRLLKASGRYYRQNYRYGIGLPIVEEATTNTTDCTSKNPIPTLTGHMSIQNIGDLETLYGFVTKTDRKYRF